MDPVRGRPGWAGNSGILRLLPWLRGRLGERQRVLLEHSWPDYNNGSRQNQPEMAWGLPVQTKIDAFVTARSRQCILQGLIGMHVRATVSFTLMLINLLSDFAAWAIECPGKGALRVCRR